MNTATVEDRLLRFIEDCWQNQYSLEILLFLGRHPTTHFNDLVFVRGSTERRMDMERAMRTLVNKGLVRVFTNTYVPLYALTAEEPVHSLVLRLASLSRQQLELAMKQVHETPGSLATVPATT